jgi:RNA polymerase sigma-70 factor (sigma-E family)
MADEEDFRRFAMGRQKQLLRSAYLLCGDWQGAEDLVQTAFGRMYRSWRRVSRVEHPDAYAKQVLYRCYLTAKRKKSFATVPIDSVPEPAAPDLDRTGPDDERLSALLTALAELPERARAVVVLRFWEDYSVAQTAEALGVSQGTVKSQTSRALALLRVRITGSLSDSRQD